MKIFYFNSENRKYEDRDLNLIHRLFIRGNGVFNSISEGNEEWLEEGDFKVTPNGGMNVEINRGVATVLVNDQRVTIDADTDDSVTIPSNPDLAFRNNAVVLRVNKSVIDNDNLNEAGDNAVSIQVVQGTSSTPLTNGEISTALGGDPFLRLADINVPQGTTEILDSMIDDRREIVLLGKGIKNASEVHEFVPYINGDPEDPQTGFMWFNFQTNTLKFRKGGRTIFLTPNDFDFGQYPPDGMSQLGFPDPLFDNGETIATDRYIYRHTDDFAENNTSAVAQRFTMPNLDVPLVRFRMGNPENIANMRVAFYNFNSGGTFGLFGAFVEQHDFNSNEIPRNGFLDLYPEDLIGGNEYVAVLLSLEDSVGGEYPPGDVYQTIRFVQHSPDSIWTQGYFGFHLNALTNDPTAMDNFVSSGTNHQIQMQFLSLNQIPLGQEDIAGNFHQIAQPFESQSGDVFAFQVRKGNDSGSPTGNIQADLFFADSNGDPMGNALGSGIITESKWNSLNFGDVASFKIVSDIPSPGDKLTVRIKADNSGADNYTILSADSLSGDTQQQARKFNTAQGWHNSGQDLMFSVEVNQIRKIVVTNNQGYIPNQLLRQRKRKFLEYTNSSFASPTINTNVYDGYIDRDLGMVTTNISTNWIDTNAFHGQTFLFQFLDNNNPGGYTINWGVRFEERGIPLPSTTEAGEWLEVEVQYDEVEDIWYPIRVQTETS